MDSIIIKQEPKCEEDFEDFSCEEEIKVCLIYIKILWYHYVEVIILTCFVFYNQFYLIIFEIVPPDFI